MKRLAVASFVSTLLWSTSAFAQDADQKACMRGFEQGQSLRRDGKLVEARENLIACAREMCSKVVAVKCEEWLGEVADEIPSVVVVAKTGGGKDIISAELRIDGESVASELDGRPIELDPGSHQLELTVAGTKKTDKILLSEGEKARRVEFVVGPATAPVPVPSTPGEGSAISPLVFAGFGLALVGVVAGSVTGAMSLSTAAELRDICPANRCSAEQQADFDSGETLAHISTVSFVLAGAGAAVGVVGLVMSTGSQEPAVSLRLSPTGALLGGRF